MINSYKKKLIFILLLILIIILLRIGGIDNYINLNSLKENREYLLSFVKNNYWISVISYISLYILVVTFSIPISAPLTLISGFLFDLIPAVIYTNISATSGATFTFLIFRYLLGNTIQKKYSQRLTKFNENLRIYGAVYLLIVRFIPVVPFFIVNILASFTKISLKTFIWTTSLGIVPGSIVFAYAGKQIIRINSLSEIFSWKVILAFSILILFSLIPIIFKKIQLKASRQVH